MALIDKIENIGDAIREKTAVSDRMTLDEMAENIRSMETAEKPMTALEFYRQDRNPDWPKIPLPSEMKDPESPYYEEKDTVYLLVDSSNEFDDHFGFTVQGSGIYLTKYFYKDTELIASGDATELASGTNYRYETKLQDKKDYPGVNYIVFKLNATSLTYFTEYYPTYQDVRNSRIVEVSFKANNCRHIDSRKFNSYTVYASYSGLYNTIYESSCYLFDSARSLKCVPEFDNPGLVNCNNLFSSCYSLMYVPDIILPNATKAAALFSNAHSLITVPSLYAPNVTDAYNIFMYAQSLKHVGVVNLQKNKSFDRIFQYCVSLESVDEIISEEVTSTQNMFEECRSLVKAPFFDTSKVTNMSYMFNVCYALREVPLYDTSNVQRMSSMFASCHALKKIPLLNTSNCVDMQVMFNECYSLEEVPQIDTSKVNRISSLFAYCYSMTKAPRLNLQSVTSILQYAFKDCRCLREVYISAINPSYNNDDLFNNMLQNDSYLEKLDINLSNTEVPIKIRIDGAYYLQYLRLRNMNAYNMYGSAANLRYLVLDSVPDTLISDGMSTLSGSYHFTGTKDSSYNPQGLKDGKIFVPDDKVDAMKASSGWSAYADLIYPISELDIE